MTQEVLKLALEALKEAQTNDDGMEKWDRNKKAITAIKEALAGAECDRQPEQEPVEWMTPDGEGFRIRFSPPVNDVPLGWDALYLAPPQRKPLTLGQKQRLWSSVGDKPTLKDRVNAYGLAIEAAHNIKE